MVGNSTIFISIFQQSTELLKNMDMNFVALLDSSSGLPYNQNYDQKTLELSSEVKSVINSSPEFHALL